jgi:hypothetical protein
VRCVSMVPIRWAVLTVKFLPLAGPQPITWTGTRTNPYVRLEFWGFHGFIRIYETSEVAA